MTRTHPICPHCSGSLVDHLSEPLVEIRFPASVFSANRDNNFPGVDIDAVHFTRIAAEKMAKALAEQAT